MAATSGLTFRNHMEQGLSALRISNTASWATASEVSAAVSGGSAMTCLEITAWRGVSGELAGGMSLWRCPKNDSVDTWAVAADADGLTRHSLVKGLRVRSEGTDHLSSWPSASESGRNPSPHNMALFSLRNVGGPADWDRATSGRKIPTAIEKKEPSNSVRVMNIQPLQGTGSTTAPLPEASSVPPTLGGPANARPFVHNCDYEIARPNVERSRNNYA